MTTTRSRKPHSQDCLTDASISRDNNTPKRETDSDGSPSAHATSDYDELQSPSSPTTSSAAPSTNTFPRTATYDESPELVTSTPSNTRQVDDNVSTTIEKQFGLQPRGRDAFATFPNNITNIKPVNYTWVKGSSNYTLCHKAPGEPRQSLLWFVGDIDKHSLNVSNTYEAWTVDILLPAMADKALDNLLRTGPWKSFNKPNQYSILRFKATLVAVKEDLLDEDDEDLASLGQIITTQDPFPYTYDGCKMVDRGSVPTQRYDISNFTTQTPIAIEASILGYQMEGRNPGYSFSMRGIYHLGDRPQDAMTTPTKKRKGGCIISPRREKAGVFHADMSQFPNHDSSAIRPE